MLLFKFLVITSALTDPTVVVWNPSLIEHSSWTMYRKSCFEELSWLWYRTQLVMIAFGFQVNFNFGWARIKLLWQCSMQQEDIIWWETILLKMSNILEQFLKYCLEVSLGEKKNLDLRQMQKIGYKIFRDSDDLRIDSRQINKRCLKRGNYKWCVCSGGEGNICTLISVRLDNHELNKSM